MSGPDGSDVDRYGLENRPSDEAPDDNRCGSRRELTRTMSEMQTASPVLRGASCTSQRH
jgi:hypothetical protein